MPLSASRQRAPARTRRVAGRAWPAGGCPYGRACRGSGPQRARGRPKPAITLPASAPVDSISRSVPRSALSRCATMPPTRTAATIRPGWRGAPERPGRSRARGRLQRLVAAVPHRLAPCFPREAHPFGGNPGDMHAMTRSADWTPSVDVVPPSPSSDRQEWASGPAVWRPLATRPVAIIVPRFEQRHGAASRRRVVPDGMRRIEAQQAAEIAPPPANGAQNSPKRERGLPMTPQPGEPQPDDQVAGDEMEHGRCEPALPAHQNKLIPTASPAPVNSPSGMYPDRRLQRAQGGSSIHSCPVVGDIAAGNVGDGH